MVLRVINLITYRIAFLFVLIHMEIELLALVLKCRIPPMFIQQEQAEESSRHWAWTICACRWNGRLAVT